MKTGRTIPIPSPPSAGHLTSIHRTALLSALLMAFAIGCGQTEDASLDAAESPLPPRSREESATTPSAATQRSKDPRPSVVFIVLDTVRADAVSAYGSVEGTTPNFDRLSRDGVLYTRAIAPAPWTVSSHATMFSGLRVDEHGVGLAGTAIVPQRLQMMAETFQEAGFETAGFSENTILTDRFGFDQGFDTFEYHDLVAMMRAQNLGEPAPPKFDILERIRLWNSTRDRDRPFFLFVNILDAHNPYIVRDANPWLPTDTAREEAEFVQAKYQIPDSLCDRLPPPEHIEILRGLYLADVAEADRKLGEILKIVRDPSETVDRLTIVTSDHGESFGSHRLMGHQFSVSNSNLHVPLVVEGLPRLRIQKIDSPVELRQLHDSILCWALDQECDATLPIERDGPEATTAAHWKQSKPVFSIYSDTVSRLPPWLVDEFGIEGHEDLVDPAREKCDEDEDPVFGDMVAMTRYPLKVTWFEKHPPMLHDLSWDPGEQSDLMKVLPEFAAPLLEELEAFAEANVLGHRPEPDAPRLDREGVEALKSLGYIQ